MITERTNKKVSMERGVVKRMSSSRMGWRDASNVISSGGRIIKFVDGYANVWDKDRYARGWLSPNSVELLNSRNDKCSVSGCPNTQGKRGICYKHISQIRRNGRIMPDAKIEKIEKIEGEVWKPIPHPRKGMYFCSNMGRVISCLSGRRKIMKPRYCKKMKVLRVQLGTGNTFSVHRLVADLFLPRYQLGKSHVIFQNGCRTDVRAENLCWLDLSRREKSIEMLKKQASIGDEIADCCVKYMEGSRDSLNGIIERWTPYVYSCICYFHRTSYTKYKYARKDIDFDSVCQDTLMKALSGIDRGLFHKASGFKAWLNKIAKNTYINYWRKEKFSLPLEFEDSDGDRFSFADDYLHKVLQRRKA